MRIVKFKYKNKPAWGLFREERIYPLKEAPFKKIKPFKKSIPAAGVKFLAPAQASKVVLVGLNYKNHAKELKMRIPKFPVLFLKPPTALIGHKDSIIYPKGVRRLDYEAELALVIKREGYKISAKSAADYILGYTCLNDVTARCMQREDIQWTRAKSFNTFCPLGPWIETDIKPASLKIRSYLNARLCQDSSTSNFIFGVEYLVSFISGIMTLNPGDVISTGTPPAVGAMSVGDTIEVVIEGIGALRNKIIKD
ncbi:MAG: fumarylacetoacetate hydrolase family protein [Candidatus Omnitrophica bacterium]|nr:fumarylacetoacetate hydrolase family protein [Candidatus Omnitrophota bacterium]